MRIILNRLSLLTIIAVFIHKCHAGATVEQLEKSGALVRNVCQPKFKVTDDIADGIKQGNFSSEKNFKCYIHCILEMMGMMKKNKLLYDSTVKQLDLLMPDELKGPMKSALTTCKDIINGVKDACDAGLTLLQCMFKNNPQFIFP